MQLKALKGFAALETVSKVKVSRKVKDEAGVERTVEEEIDKLVISPKDLVRLMESAYRLQKDLLGNPSSRPSQSSAPPGASSFRTISALSVVP